MGKVGKGTGSFGRRSRKKTHGLCPRCGKRSFHMQHGRCACCFYPNAKRRRCAFPAFLDWKASFWSGLFLGGGGGRGFMRTECDGFSWVLRTVNWSKKSIRRRTTGTGRMRYLKSLPRRFRNGFREGEWDVQSIACHHTIYSFLLALSFH